MSFKNDRMIDITEKEEIHIHLLVIKIFDLSMAWPIEEEKEKR